MGEQMFEHYERLNLESIDEVLRWKFETIQLIGQLGITREDFVRLAAEVKSQLVRNPGRLKQIPKRVLLLLMVFCARYEDTSAGFWGAFCEKIGLQSEGGVQSRCRQLLDESWRKWQHIYFPSGGYKYVTRILYHSIIPQARVEEMARLISSLGSTVGWDAIADMEIEELERLLGQAEGRFHLSGALRRFLTDVHSRPLASQLVQDLCEAACLYLERGRDQGELIEQLQQHPVQLEVWERLAALQDEMRGMAGPGRLNMTAPRWQWDRKSRQLRLYIPAQRITCSSRPACYLIDGEKHPVEAKRVDQGWELGAVLIHNLRIRPSLYQKFTCRLVGEDGTKIDERSVMFHGSEVLFFRPGGSDLGTLVSHDQGIGMGYWYVLLRKGYRLGNARRIETHLPPRGLDENYQGFLYQISREESLLLMHDETDSVERRIQVTESHRRLLTLEGAELPEADEPDGTKTFTGEAPRLVIEAGNWQEVGDLLLQIRRKTGALDVQTFLLRDLARDGLLTGLDGPGVEVKLTIDLERLIGSGQVGRFRVKLLRGLQRAQYPPIEFNLVPALRFEPGMERIAGDLFTELAPPRVRIDAAAAVEVTSRDGRIESLDGRVHEVVWDAFAADYSVDLKWDDLRVRAVFHPAVLRAGLRQIGGPVAWIRDVQVWHSEMMSFDSTLIVEAQPGGSYRLVIGDIDRPWRNLNDYGRFEAPLAELKDNVNENAAQRVPIYVDVRHRHREYRMLLAYLDRCLDESGEGAELIAAMPPGQVVYHRYYKRGVVRGFTDAVGLDHRLNFASLAFDLYPDVTFFIPASRRLRLYDDDHGLLLSEMTESGAGGPFQTWQRITFKEKGD